MRETSSLYANSTIFTVHIQYYSSLPLKHINNDIKLQCSNKTISQLEKPGEHPSWIVCNVSCDHPSVPEGTSGYTRATIEVVLFCQTVCDKTDPTRKDVSCRIVYSASVNPGGWAPSAAVRAVSQREYPKFLKKISAFAVDHVKKNEIAF